MPRSYSTDAAYSDSSYLSSPVSRSDGWYQQMGVNSLVPQSHVPVCHFSSPGSSISSPDISSQHSTASKKQRKTEDKALSKTSISSKTPFSCQVCSRKFTKKTQRDEHETSHSDEKLRVRCSEAGCDKYFGRQADATRHIKSVSRGNSGGVSAYC